jgi:hypothetical protein
MVKEVIKVFLMITEVHFCLRKNFLQSQYRLHHQSLKIFTVRATLGLSLR